MLPRSASCRAALLLALALVVSATSVARADSDPPSDVLPLADTYYPYPPFTPSAAYKKALDALVKKAKGEGYAVKVAIVGSASDLGAVPQYLTDPAKYANFLIKEIAFNSQPRLLVVLPSGISGVNLGNNVNQAVDSINVPSNPSGNNLVQVAMTALSRLATANGHPLALPAIGRITAGGGGPGGTSSGNGKSGGTSTLLVFGVPVLLIVAAAAVAAARSRREGEDDAEDDDEDLDDEPEEGEDDLDDEPDDDKDAE